MEINLNDFCTSLPLPFKISILFFQLDQLDSS